VQLNLGCGGSKLNANRRVPGKRVRLQVRLEPQPVVLGLRDGWQPLRRRGGAERRRCGERGGNEEQESGQIAHVPKVSAADAAGNDFVPLWRFGCDEPAIA
jgi:hypothetical protein